MDSFTCSKPMMHECWSELLGDMQHFAKFRFNLGNKFTSLITDSGLTNSKVRDEFEKRLRYSHSMFTFSMICDNIHVFAKHVYSCKDIRTSCFDKGNGPYKSISHTLNGSAGVGYDVMLDLVDAREIFRFWQY